MTDAENCDTEANRRTISDVFDAWQEGSGVITDVFAPGMVWRIGGHSMASKQYNSK